MKTDKKKISISDLLETSGVRFGTSGARGLVADMTSEVCFAYASAFLQATSGLPERCLASFFARVALLLRLRVRRDSACGDFGRLLRRDTHTGAAYFAKVKGISHHGHRQP